MVSRAYSVFKDFLSTPHTAGAVEIFCSTRDLLSRSVLNPTHCISPLTSHPSASSLPIPCGYALKETAKCPTKTRTVFMTDFLLLSANLFHYLII